MDYTPMRPSGSTGYPELSGAPSWIIFCAGQHQARLPFIDEDKSGWGYVLDVTSLGFRADRVGNAIVITGRPNEGSEVLAS
jgi:hypothetical protein